MALGMSHHVSQLLLGGERGVTEHVQKFLINKDSTFYQGFSISVDNPPVRFRISDPDSGSAGNRSRSAHFLSTSWLVVLLSCWSRGSDSPTDRSNRDAFRLSRASQLGGTQPRAEGRRVVLLWSLLPPSPPHPRPDAP